MDATVEEILVEGGDSVAVTRRSLRAVKPTAKAQKSVQAAASKAGTSKNAGAEQMAAGDNDRGNAVEGWQAMESAVSGNESLIQMMLRTMLQETSTHIMSEQKKTHSFMHDLESFFWVLFWICIHYNRPGEGRVVPRFDKWNYVDMEELAISKKGVIEGDFLKIAEANFTSYYQPLIPWVNRLRKTAFPNGGRWGGEDRALYARMRETLLEAGKDPKVLAER